MKSIVLFAFAVFAAGPAAATAQVPPEQQDLITMMTTGGAAELERAAARASAIPLEERSPELRAAMGEGLRRAAFELGRHASGTDYDTFLHVARFGVAAHGDPADIPVLVQYNIGGAEARALYNHGHLAVPHLIVVAMSPETVGDVVRASLGVSREHRHPARSRKPRRGAGRGRHPPHGRPPSAAASGHESSPAESYRPLLWLAWSELPSSLHGWRRSGPAARRNSRPAPART